MDDSKLIACSDYILECGTESGSHDEVRQARMYLKHLRTFVLCARRMYNNGELGSFLAQIQGMMDEISDFDSVYEISELLIRIRDFIESSAEEIEKWYVMMMNCIASDCVLTVEFVLKIITYILEILLDGYFVHSLATIELEEQLGSLRSLIQFVARGGFEEVGDLLTYAERISLNAARILLRRQLGHLEVDRIVYMSPEILGSVEIMKPANAQAGQIYTQALTCSKLSRPLFKRDWDFMVVMSFVESLILNVMKMNSTCHMNQLQDLYEGLILLRATLMQQPNYPLFDMELMHKFAEVVCDIGISIYSMLQAKGDDGLGLPGLLQGIRNALAEMGESWDPPQLPILPDIASLMVDVSKIDQVKQVESKIHRSMPLQTAGTDDVIGFKNEIKSILDRLKYGSKQLQVIAVVGMPGQGKTTLATKVYNDESISCHFSVRAWCPISQEFDKKSILLDLLKQIDPNTSSEMSVNDLANKLRRSLKGRRYIIFLDDIWNMEAWNSLRDSFPDDSKGSRIILTSRSHEMPDEQPLILTQLSSEESLELLRRKLFNGSGNEWPPELLDLGMQMIEKCKGLPLSIVILAGVIANIEPSGWKEILDSLSLVSAAESCRYTLELSYNHLPYYLRPCLLYVGSFPEDEEISVERLTRLWLAEGFVQKSESQSREDVAEDYLKSLIGRSLIIAGKQRYDGRMKTLRIHDLLRDFFIAKAKDEQFFHFVKGRNELLSFSELRGLRRLCIDGEGEDFKEPKLFCRNARSLLLISSRKLYGKFPRMLQMLHWGFKLLKVLDLEKISVGNTFPVEIEHLLLLAFLAITGLVLIIPTWIANLSKLESLIVSCTYFSLPDSLWKMQKLQYLHISGYGQLPCYVDSSCVLHELETLSGPRIYLSTMEKQLSKFPCIRKLKCEILMDVPISETETEYPVKFVFPYFLSKLESLHMTAYDSETRTSFEFTSLTSLKKLVLSDFDMYLEMLSTIGEQLPNLEVLKLDGLRFEYQEKPTWEMKKGEFSKLRILHLTDMPIHAWRCSDDHEFECFQKLVLRGCHVLEEIPSCLENIATLERIELYYYTESVLILAQNIQREQQNWGNTIVLETSYALE